MDTSVSLASNFKVRYGAFQNPLPEDNSISDFAKFVKAEERPGKQLEFPIKVSHEHGVTHDKTDSAFALEAAVDSVMKTAIVDGTNIMMVANIAYPIMARAKAGVSRGGGSGGAFWKPIDYKVESLMVAAELYRELAIMYGPGPDSTALCNIGVTAAAAITGANLAAGQVVRLTTASWAPGIWPQMIGGFVDIYESDGSTLRESEVEVTAVGKTNCRLTLQKDGSTASVGSGDILLVKLAHGNSCIGVQPILENTGSMFNIDASVYPMWQAESFAVGGALTRAKIGQFASRLFPTGLKGGGKMFGGSAMFADLVEETSQLQQYTSNTDSVKRQGADNLEYLTSIGKINVALHRYMKQGIAMFFARDVLKRVGSTDLTFSLDGTNEWFYREMDNNAGCQIRIFTNQAPIVEIPWFCGILTGIASNADIASA